MSQRRFHAALLNPELAVPETLTDGFGGPAGRRFAVYRNNVAVGLTDALVEGFPTLTRLIGEQNLRRIAAPFLRAHPPDSPLMQRYGAELPLFLETLPSLDTMGYLPDMARLDLLMRQSYHAGDDVPYDPARLREIPPEALFAARFRFAPAMRLLRSRWPVHDIWRAAWQHDAPKPRGMAQDILIVRPGFDPEPLLLPAGGGAFVAALIGGASPLLAYEKADDEATEPDLSALLALLLHARVITDVEMTDD